MVAIDVGPLHGQRTGIGHAVAGVVGALSAVDGDRVDADAVRHEHPRRPANRHNAACRFRPPRRSAVVTPSAPTVDRGSAAPTSSTARTTSCRRRAARRRVGVRLLVPRAPARRRCRRAPCGGRPPAAVRNGAHVVTSSSGDDRAGSANSRQPIGSHHPSRAPARTDHPPRRPPASLPDLGAAVHPRARHGRASQEPPDARRRVRRWPPSTKRPLVIAGAPGNDAAAVDRAIIRWRPTPAAVVVLGPVGDVEKTWLLASRTALAYPSLDEGFGFPILEAQQLGTPVVASTGRIDSRDRRSRGVELAAGRRGPRRRTLYWVVNSDDMHAKLVRAAGNATCPVHLGGHRGSPDRARTDDPSPSSRMDVDRRRTDRDHGRVRAASARPVPAWADRRRRRPRRITAIVNTGDDCRCTGCRSRRTSTPSPTRSPTRSTRTRMGLVDEIVAGHGIARAVRAGRGRPGSNAATSGSASATATWQHTCTEPPDAPKAPRLTDGHRRDPARLERPGAHPAHVGRPAVDHVVRPPTARSRSRTTSSGSATTSRSRRSDSSATRRSPPTRRQSIETADVDRDRSVEPARLDRPDSPPRGCRRTARAAPRASRRRVADRRRRGAQGSRRTDDDRARTRAHRRRRGSPVRTHRIGTRHRPGRRGAGLGGRIGGDALHRAAIGHVVAHDRPRRSPSRRSPRSADALERCRGAAVAVTEVVSRRSTPSSSEVHDDHARWMRARTGRDGESCEVVGPSGSGDRDPGPDRHRSAPRARARGSARRCRR